MVESVATFDGAGGTLTPDFFAAIVAAGMTCMADAKYVAVRLAGVRLVAACVERAREFPGLLSDSMIDLRPAIEAAVGDGDGAVAAAAVAVQRQLRAVRLM